MRLLPRLPWAVGLHGVVTCFASRKAAGFDSLTVHHMSLWCSWCARESEELKDAVRFRGDPPLNGRLVKWLSREAVYFLSGVRVPYRSPLLIAGQINKTLTVVGHTLNMTRRWIIQSIVSAPPCYI